MAEGTSADIRFAVTPLEGVGRPAPAAERRDVAGVDEVGPLGPLDRQAVRDGEVGRTRVRVYRPRVREIEAGRRVPGGPVLDF